MKSVLVQWTKGQLFIKSSGATNADLISLLEMAKAVVLQKTVGQAQEVKEGVISAPAAALGRKVDQT